MINKKTPPLPDLYYGNNSPSYYVIHFIMWRNIFISLLSLTQNNGLIYALHKNLKAFTKFTKSHHFIIQKYLYTRKFRCFFFIKYKSNV